MALKADHYRHVALLRYRKPLHLRWIAHAPGRYLSARRDGHAIFRLLLLHLQHHHHLLLLLKCKSG